MTTDTALPETLTSAARCPIDHSAFRQQKTVQVAETFTKPIERTADGVWHIYGYNEARQVLRSEDMHQAGFNAEVAGRAMGDRRRPILYQEGQTHHEQRRATARFFTPKAVSDNYRQMMEATADELINELRTKKQVNLSDMSMVMAVRVAAAVIGLTESRLPGMTQRLDAFFTTNPPSEKKNVFTAARKMLSRSNVLAFFYLDVKPAIEARRKQPKEDLISHLVQQEYTDLEILTECITFGAAGMATTREFISVAIWHLLEQPTLLDQYLHGDEAQRYRVLHEILRLEPVVGHLYRRATTDLVLTSNDVPVIIPKGSLIDINLYATNTDQALVGDQPALICPARELSDRKAGTAVMSFGDGHHRCPGAYIAIQETDLFLRRLLRVEGMLIRQKPTVSWSPLTAGYELRQFYLAIEP